MTTELATLKFDYDQKAPLDVQAISVEMRDGVKVRDITFASPLGGRVAAFLVEPPDTAPAAPHPGILWIHWLEPASPHSNRLQFVDEAVTLAEQGVVSILPDGFWSTTPAKSVNVGQFGWNTEFGHDRDVSIKQVIELRRALDVLLAQPGIDPSRIGYVGHDFGAMYGALVAAIDRRPQKYVFLTPTYSFADWFVFGSKYSDEENAAYQKEMAVLDPTRFVSQAAPAKLFFQFAHHDYYVPERAAQVLYNAASDPKEIAWYDAAHDMEDRERLSVSDRLSWLRKELGLPEVA
jgi:cephalosporin-C deacetylase-like acetyl esterase